MKIKTNELKDRGLDWAVIIALGWADAFAKYGFALGDFDCDYTPSSDWSQGGPIIEREGITISKEDGCWSAYFRDNLFEDDGSEHWQTGPSPLIAACRCFVAIKLGDTVDVPDELI